MNILHRPQATGKSVPGARLAFRHCAVEIEIGRAGRERLEEVLAAEVS